MREFSHGAVFEAFCDIGNRNPATPARSSPGELGLAAATCHLVAEEFAAPLRCIQPDLLDSVAAILVLSLAKIQSERRMDCV